MNIFKLTRHREINRLVIIEGYKHAVATSFNGNHMICSVVYSDWVHVLDSISIHHDMAVALKKDL